MAIACPERSRRGNLKSLVRVDSAGTPMDSLIYRYQVNRNRLTHVDDPGGVAGNHSFDVDDQDTNNYTYDATGNLTSDAQEGITNIEWTPSNKIRSITKGSTSKLEYTYDAMGNRVVKRYYQPANTLKSTTWYVRDAQGNILSVYERTTPTSAITQTEVHIYGSSRIGIEQRNITYSTSPFAWIGTEQHRHAGTKRYELTDHLGNVRVTVSDLLVDRPTGFGYATQDAEVMDRRDYYPFGMEMPGRRWRATGEDAARFGFNGKENDNEVKGEGNQQDYGFRIYDPRIARFLSVDPLAPDYPELTTYQFASNTPIWATDLDGLEARVYTETDGFGHTFITLGTGENLVVYSYGRYARASSSESAHDGVLMRYSGTDARQYLATELHKYDAQAFEIKDADEGKLRRWFEAMWQSGSYVTEGNTQLVEKLGRRIDEYNLFTRNCTSVVCDALKLTGSKVFDESIDLGVFSIDYDEDFVIPLSLEKFLEWKSDSSPSLVGKVTDGVKAGVSVNEAKPTTSGSSVGRNSSSGASGESVGTSTNSSGGSSTSGNNSGSSSGDVNRP